MKVWVSEDTASNLYTSTAEGVWGKHTLPSPPASYQMCSREGLSSHLWPEPVGCPQLDVCPSHPVWVTGPSVTSASRWVTGGWGSHACGHMVAHLGDWGMGAAVQTDPKKKDGRRPGQGTNLSGTSHWCGQRRALLLFMLASASLYLPWDIILTSPTTGSPCQHIPMISFLVSVRQKKKKKKVAVKTFSPFLKKRQLKG